MSILKRTIFLALIIVSIFAIPSFATSKGTIKEGGVRLRKEANTTSDILILMEVNAQVEVIEKTGDWYKIKYKDNIGYVRNDLIKVTEVVEEKVEETPKKEESNTQTEEKLEKKASEELAVYIVPLINASKVNNIVKGTTVTIQNKINKWVYVHTSNVSGWVLYDKLIDLEQTVTASTNNVSENPVTNNNTPATTTSTETALNKIGYVKVDSARVRKEASTNAEVVSGLIYNQQIKIISKVNDWYKIEIDGGYGYVANWLISDTKLETTNRSLETTRTTNVTTQNIETITTNSADLTSSTGSEKAKQLVEYAKQYLGCKYVYGGKGPNTFDCAGFVQYVYKHFGYSLSGGATSQSKTSGATKINKADLQLGDIVFFLDYQTMDGIGHVGIYIGEGNFIHASSGSPAQVKISTLLTGSYNTRYHSAIRIIK